MCKRVKLVKNVKLVLSHNGDGMDVIFTDIIGARLLRRSFGEAVFQKAKCKMRILDRNGFCDSLTVLRLS